MSCWLVSFWYEARRSGKKGRGRSVEGGTGGGGEVGRGGKEGRRGRGRGSGYRKLALIRNEMERRSFCSSGFCCFGVMFVQLIGIREVTFWHQDRGGCGGRSEDGRRRSSRRDEDGGRRDNIRRSGDGTASRSCDFRGIRDGQQVFQVVCGI